MRRLWVWSGLLLVASILYFVMNPVAVEALDRSHSFYTVTEIMPSGLLLFLYVVLLPIAEEIVFRYWLVAKRAWGVVLVLAVISLVSATVMPYLLSALLFGTSAILLFRFYSGFQRFLSGRVVVSICLSSLIFALIHLVNFGEFNSHNVVLMVWFFALGIVFGVLRIRKGIRASMAVHALYNFGVIALLLPAVFPVHRVYGDQQEFLVVARGLVPVEQAVEPGWEFKCESCTKKALVRRALEYFDKEALLEFEPGLFVNPLERYDFYVKSDFTRMMDSAVFRTIVGDLGLDVTPSREDREIYEIEGMYHEDFMYGAERFGEFLRNRASKSIQISISPFVLARSMEAHYGVGVRCRGSCDLPLILRYDPRNSPERNLEELRSLGVLDYTMKTANIPVLRISETR